MSGQTSEPQAFQLPLRPSSGDYLIHEDLGTLKAQPRQEHPQRYPSTTWLKIGPFPSRSFLRFLDVSPGTGRGAFIKWFDLEAYMEYSAMF